MDHQVIVLPVVVEVQRLAKETSEAVVVDVITREAEAEQDQLEYLDPLNLMGAMVLLMLF